MVEVGQKNDNEFLYSFPNLLFWALSLFIFKKIQYLRIRCLIKYMISRVPANWEKTLLALKNVAKYELMLNTENLLFEIWKKFQTIKYMIFVCFRWSTQKFTNWIMSLKGSLCHSRKLRYIKKFHSLCDGIKKCRFVKSKC